MDEVGAHGQGESVWLGWFLASLLPPFASIAEARGDVSRRRFIAHMAIAWPVRSKKPGTASGTAARTSTTGRRWDPGRRTECRIDSIAQSWSVISGLGDPERAAQAMQSVDRWLVDRERQLILLLTPPFDKAEPNPGYIRGYVPGVRENGGQYTHAALWVVLAQALLGRGDARTSC